MGMIVLNHPEAPAQLDGNRKRRSRSMARIRFEQIYNEIRTRICLLIYPPGTVLRESELAAEFNMSRTPVRKVLSCLEFDGLVEVKHGIGTIVSSDVLDDLHDIYEFRMKLAEQIGILNPIRPTEENIEATRAILTQLRAIGINLTPHEYWKFNTALQIQLENCTGNRWLREASDRLYFLTNRNWQARVPKQDWRMEIEHFARELEEIIRCMENGDVVGIGMVRRNAIYASYLRLLEYRKLIGVAQSSTEQ